MVRTCIPLGEVYRQPDRRCHRPAVHGTRSIRNDQRIGPCFHIVRQLTPLGFQRFIFPDPNPTPPHLHDSLDDIVRKQSRRVDGLLAMHCLLYESTVTISIMLHESPSVDHHGSGRNRREADLIPASGRHERFNDTDLLTHCTHQTLELIYRVTELLRS